MHVVLTRRVWHRLPWQQPEGGWPGPPDEGSSVHDHWQVSSGKKAQHTVDTHGTQLELSSKSLTMLFRGNAVHQHRAASDITRANVEADSTWKPTQRGSRLNVEADSTWNLSRAGAGVDASDQIPSLSTSRRHGSRRRRRLPRYGSRVSWQRERRLRRRADAVAVRGQEETAAAAVCTALGASLIRAAAAALRALHWAVLDAYLQSR